MVKHCSFGTCKSDSRYPDKLNGAKFIPFPKPKTNFQKCVRWIALCRRPQYQLNVNKITKDTYICTKHFFNNDGPTAEYPDPCDAKTGELQKARHLPSYRSPSTYIQNTTCNGIPSLSKFEDMDMNTTDAGVCCHETGCQTIFSSMDMLAMAARIHELEKENQELHEAIAALPSNNHCSTATQTETHVEHFSVESVSNSKIKNLFEYYTGMTYLRFLMLISFLFPKGTLADVNPVTYDASRDEVKRLPVDQQVFMFLCRIRSGLQLKDLACRFDLKIQSVSTILKGISKYMYYRLGSLSSWPHRNKIMQDMFFVYTEEFPNVVMVIDCTEIKIQRPSSLLCHTQCFSEHSSATTLKSLVVCDTRGSVLFVSDLFCSAVSDNDVCIKSGFFQYLKNLMEQGSLHPGDSIMADRGFRIEDQLAEMGLKLSVSPFASSVHSTSEANGTLTGKIPAHRTPVERAINQIKHFKIFSRKIPANLLHSINEYWVCASLLTNFQDTVLK
ncbi:uncharacterized protein LOC125669203 isoform X2 [Ostrea edulis]|uniref:uncharacterized protein LOC125669203 isoform X2 n=1 Tax=Ostrea edulis TaxID=37623 RepID=UPI0024AFABC3|nr:uncharacterized protein LOC125669203 isoform X2 [Ostrea edulis]